MEARKKKIERNKNGHLVLKIKSQDIFANISQPKIRDEYKKYEEANDDSNTDDSTESYNEQKKFRVNIPENKSNKHDSDNENDVILPTKRTKRSTHKEDNVVVKVERNIFEGFQKSHEEYVIAERKRQREAIKSPVRHNKNDNTPSRKSNREIKSRIEKLAKHSEEVNNIYKSDIKIILGYTK